MSEKSTKKNIKSEENTLSTNQINKIPEPEKVYTISCACCNQDINGFSIGIIYYGSMIHLCGSPCGVRDYLDTQ